MPTLKIPTPLRTYTGGQSEVPVQGATVGEALDDLMSQFPALKPHLMSEEGRLRAFVNLFLGEENTRDLQGLSTPLGTDSQLRIIPSIAGGVSRILANSTNSTNLWESLHA
jgi:molybdopterin converting factor small subunit